MQTKSIFQSKTFYGVVILVAGIFGVPTAGLEAELSETATSVCGVVGGILAIYGRIKARGPATILRK